MESEYRLKELDKLEIYLQDKGIRYERIDDFFGIERHQVVVFNNEGLRSWDAICHHGSYGWEDGLLEIMGTIVLPCGDSVEGWLTAEDVIERIEEHERSIN